MHTRPRGLERHDFMSLTAPRMPDTQTLIISLNIASSCFRLALHSLPGSGGNAVRLLILRTFYLGATSAFLLQDSGSFFIPYKAPSPLHPESVCALEEAAVCDGSTAFGGQEVRSGVELAWGCRAIAEQGHYLTEQSGHNSPLISFVLEASLSPVLKISLRTMKSQLKLIQVDTVS